MKDRIRKYLKQNETSIVIISTGIGFLFFIFIISKALASPPVSNNAINGDSMIEHFDFIKASFIAALGYIVWSWRTMLEDFKKTIRDIYHKYNSLSADLHRLQGEHDAMMHSCGIKKTRKEDEQE